MENIKDQLSEGAKQKLEVTRVSVREWEISLKEAQAKDEKG